MTIRRRLLELVSVAVLLVLVLAVSEYQHRSDLLRLEGNRLYTADAVSVEIDPAHASGLVKQAGGGMRAFAVDPANPQIRVLAAADPGSLGFPVSRGRSFSSSDRRAALVGSRFAQPPGQWLKVGADGVPVIGTLGAVDDSLLGDDALVLDDTVFARVPVKHVVLDGPGARSAAERAVGTDKVEPARQGVAARTDTDLLTPLVLRLSWTVIGLSGLVVALAMAAARSRLCAFLHLQGATRVRLILHSAVAAVATTSGAALLVASAGSALGMTTSGTAVPRVSAVSLAVAAGVVIAIAWNRPWRTH